MNQNSCIVTFFIYFTIANYKTTEKVRKDFCVHFMKPVIPRGQILFNLIFYKILFI